MISQSWQQLIKGSSLKMNGKRKAGVGDGTPMGAGFLAYPKEMKFGVRVSMGNIGE